MVISCIAYLHGFGGAEKQLIELANQMAEVGHTVNLLLVSEDRISYQISEKVVLHSLMKAERKNKVITILNRRYLLIKKLKELKSDVVVNFNFQSAYLLTLRKHPEIGKIIYAERGDPGDKEYGGTLGLVRNLVLHKIDGYVFQSEGARDYFEDNYVKSHSIIIPNACFLGKQVKSLNRTKRIVNVGRLSEQKNQHLLIRAFSEISSQFPDYTLEIYGDGELKDNLLSVISNYKLSSKIKLKGTTKDITNAIRNASLFVLSSDFEGVPNALIEAMALGIPCISTDCKPGGARTLINNNINGLITPIGDSESLSNAMAFMLNNPHKAEEMATNAQIIAEELSPQSTYSKWELFLKRICNFK